MVRKTIVGLAVLIVGAMGCVEEPTPEPNSAEGYLFVELERDLAVEWVSEVTVMGPLNGETVCVDDQGCRHDHHRVEVEAVRTSDGSVLEVIDHRSETVGGVDAVILEIEAHASGQADLEFEVRLPTYREQDDDDDEEVPLREDSYLASASEADELRLARDLGDMEEPSPYEDCPEQGGGLYLMDELGQYRVSFIAEFMDRSGTPLHGVQETPFEVAPEEAVSVERGDDPSRYLVRAESYGEVQFQAVDGEGSLAMEFVGHGDISSLTKELYRLDGEGRRAGAAEQLLEGELYEAEIGPDLQGYPPLCGGSMDWEIETLSPAICDIVGVTVDRGNAAIQAMNLGECTLRATLHGASMGQGVTEDFVYWVEAGW